MELSKREAIALDLLKCSINNNRDLSSVAVKPPPLGGGYKAIA